MTLAGRPFYDARPDPAGGTSAWTLDDLCDFAAAVGDPYGGRLAGGPFDPSSDQIAADRLPPFSLQLEAGEPPVWVLLSAGSYVPGLGRGATDRLGADMFCNDGMGNMALRMAEAIRVVRPSAMVVRADVAFLLAGDCDTCDLFHVDAEFYDLEPLPGGEGGRVRCRITRTPA